jgi:hypothetical protein
MTDPWDSVLVIFPGALGDLICLVPTLRAIARRHPDAGLELMARAELVRFATGRLGLGWGRTGAVQRHSDSATGRLGVSAKHSLGAGHGPSRGHSIDRREVAQLFAARAGVIAQEARTFFGSFSHVYSFFAADDDHFCRALDAASGGRASCFPFRPPGVGHVAAAYLRAIRAPNDSETAGKDLTKPGGEEEAPAPDCSFQLDCEDLELAADRLAGLGLTVRNFMLILPGSGSTAKNWPAQSFVILATMLASRVRPLVILGPAESGLEPVFAASGIPVISQLELAEVAALARLSRCFIGNDSGVSHLAAAAGASGLVIFGPSDPERWRPLGRTVVIRREPLSALAPAAVAAAMIEKLDAEITE